MTYLEGETTQENNNNENSYLIKFIIVGDSSVGKSNIMLRFTQDKFEKDRKTTLGVEFANKQLIYNNTVYTIQIWDTAGQEQFKSIIRGYYKDSAVALVVYDITNEESFEHIQNWINDCQNLAPSSILIILMGNKNDLENERKISKEKGENLANEYNMTFFETSALNGNGIQDVFQKCIETIDNRIKEGFYNLDSDKHGIKRIKKDNGNSLGGTIIDKKGLMEGGKSKNKKICCL